MRGAMSGFEAVVTSNLAVIPDKRRSRAALRSGRDDGERFIRAGARY
jgi:hypothetical protein